MFVIHSSSIIPAITLRCLHLGEQHIIMHRNFHMPSFGNIGSEDGLGDTPVAGAAQATMETTPPESTQASLPRSLETQMATTATMNTKYVRDGQC